MNTKVFTHEGDAKKLLMKYGTEEQADAVLKSTSLKQMNELLLKHMTNSDKVLCNTIKVRLLCNGLLAPDVSVQVSAEAA